MAFEKIAIWLTDEQAQALKPFSKRIHNKEASNVFAQVFIVESDSRYRSVDIYLLDDESTQIIRDAIARAQALYDARMAKAKRLTELAEAMRYRALNVKISNDALLIVHDGHRYELREAAQI